jgi:hypothetical protein
MRSRRILREPAKLLKSFLKHIPLFLFSRTTGSSNVATACFKAKARERLPKKGLSGSLKFIGGTIFHRQKEKT